MKTTDKIEIGFEFVKKWVGPCVVCNIFEDGGYRVITYRNDNYNKSRYWTEFEHDFRIEVFESLQELRKYQEKFPTQNDCGKN